MHIKAMNETDCLAFLAANRLARLACSVDDRPYLVPIHYAFRNHFIYAFSMPGRKVEAMRANPNVALLVEEFGEGRIWKSVIAEGRFEELPDRIGSKIERDHAWSLLSRHANWWEPGALKPDMAMPADEPHHIFFRVSIDSLSGRESIA